MTVLLREVGALSTERRCGKCACEGLGENTIAKHVYEKFDFACYELDPSMGKAMSMEMKLCC